MAGVSEVFILAEMNDIGGDRSEVLERISPEIPEALPEYGMLVPAGELDNLYGKPVKLTKKLGKFVGGEYRLLVNKERHQALLSFCRSPVKS